MLSTGPFVAWILDGSKPPLTASAERPKRSTLVAAALSSSLAEAAPATPPTSPSIATATSRRRFWPTVLVLAITEDLPFADETERGIVSTRDGFRVTCSGSLFIVASDERPADSLSKTTRWPRRRIRRDRCISP